MGELLRAICDANAVDSQPTFYPSILNITVPMTGTTTRAVRRGTVQIEKDTHFLLTGWGQYSWVTTDPASSIILQTPANSFEFLITNARTGFQYSSSLTPKPNANHTISEWFTLPEYPLFEPGDLIQVDQWVTITTNGAAVFYMGDTVVLSGIEYRF